MEFNLITPGIELVGTTIKFLKVENSIVDIEKGGTRSFGLNINEPTFKKAGEQLFSQMEIEIEIEILQSDEQRTKLELVLEGAFLSTGDIEESKFVERVMVNGASALIGIARGKLESISANIFNNGKVVIPFVNVIDYYKSLEK